MDTELEKTIGKKLDKVFPRIEGEFWSFADDVIEEFLGSKTFEEAASNWAREHGWEEPE